MRNNKGFSLVELIIVIAIMAILVGVMAPQLIKYIEKSNVASDTQLADAVHSAVVTSMMDPEVVTSTLAATQTELGDLATAHDVVTVATGSSGQFSQSVRDILGITGAPSANDFILKSHNGTATLNATDVMVSVDGNRCYVWITGSDASGSKGSGANSVEITVY